MKPEILLTETAAKVLEGKESPEKFYTDFWDRMAAFDAKQIKIPLELSRQIAQSDQHFAPVHLFAQGVVCVFTADFLNGITHFLSALKAFTNANETGGIMACNTMLTTCYRAMGRLDEAQNYVQNALQYVHKLEEGSIFTYFLRVTFYQSAELNVHLKKYERAIEDFHGGLSFPTANPELNSRMYDGLGVIYTILEKWDEAIEYLEKALATVADSNNKLIESKVLADIGIYYFKRKQYEQALNYQEQSLKIRLDNNMLNPVITNYIQLADLCLASGDLEKAKRYGLLAAEQAEKLKVHIKLFEAHHVLSKIFEQNNEIEKAFFHYKKYHHYKEEVHSQEVTSKIEQLNNRHKIESAEQEKEIFRLRNVELREAFSEIETKNKEITDSIRYALRIQRALITNEIYIAKHLKRLANNK